jgi:hypothetical protein
LRATVWPSRDVAGSEDAGDAGFQIFVYHHAAVDFQPGAFGNLQPRPHADTDDHQIGAKLAAAFERDVLSGDFADGVFEVENDTVLFVQRLDHVAVFGAEHALQRTALRRSDVDFDVTRAQRGRGFEADEAGPDHHRLPRGLCLGDDRA